MKNKYVKYGLLIVVALIWGNILISYFGLFNTSDDLDYVPEEIVKSAKIAKTTREYKLNLDYKDPFLGHKAIVQVKTNKISSTVVSIKKMPISANIVEPTISYKGLVKNKNSSKKTGLIAIDGKSHLITINYKTEVIRIISFNDTECKYEYNGKITTLTK